MIQSGLSDNISFYEAMHFYHSSIGRVKDVPCCSTDGLSDAPPTDKIYRTKAIIWPTCRLYQRARLVSPVGQSRVRASQVGSCEGGAGDGVGAGGGEGFVGPIFTSWTFTSSSPVVTSPPVLLPVSTVPFVSLVMPPLGCGEGEGVMVGMEEGGGGTERPLRRLSRVSA